MDCPRGSGTPGYIGWHSQFFDIVYESIVVVFTQAGTVDESQ